MQEGNYFNLYVEISDAWEKSIISPINKAPSNYLDSYKTTAMKIYWRPVGVVKYCTYIQQLEKIKAKPISCRRTHPFCYARLQWPLRRRRITLLYIFHHHNNTYYVTNTNYPLVYLSAYKILIKLKIKRWAGRAVQRSHCLAGDRERARSEIRNLEPFWMRSEIYFVSTRVYSFGSRPKLNRLQSHKITHSRCDVYGICSMVRMISRNLGHT